MHILSQRHHYRELCAYNHGAPGPAIAHFQEHSLVDPKRQDGDQQASFRDWEHRAEEEQSELQPSYEGKQERPRGVASVNKWY